MIATTIQLSPTEFVELKDLIYKNSGIMFMENKKYLLENRLSKRVTDLNFTTFKDYIYYLKYDTRKRAEIDTMINLVTINETYFLRERGQMDYLVSTIIPELISKGKRSIKIWSVPCSTGEEPYSIAALLIDSGLYLKANIDILATDINSEVVEDAKHGVYHSASFRGCPQEFISKHFKQDGQVYRINEDVKSKVRFNTGNITSPGVAMIAGKMDVIFCRNVLIYFDIEGKKKAIDNFHKLLNDPGYLCLGHSETLQQISTDFVLKNFGTGILYLKK